MPDSDRPRTSNSRSRNPFKRAWDVVSPGKSRSSSRPLEPPPRPEDTDDRNEVRPGNREPADGVTAPASDAEHATEGVAPIQGPQEPNETTPPPDHPLLDPGPVRDNGNPPDAPHVEALPVGSLWEQAFTSLSAKAEYAEYAARYERILVGIQDPTAPMPAPLDRQDQMRMLIDNQTARLKDSRWAWVIAGRKVYAAEVVEKIVQGIIYAKGVVEAIIRVSGEPHAAVAWAGVCLLLPLITGPTTQKKAAIDLLGCITDRVNGYYVLEETFRNPPNAANVSEKVGNLRNTFVEKTLAMYEEILKAQVLLACNYARSSFLRYGRAVLQWDDWSSLQKSIEKHDEAIQSAVRALNYARNLRSEMILAELRTDQDKLLKALQEQSQLQKEKRKSKCLQCFSSVLEYRATKEQVADRLEGTFDWFVEDQRFIAWRDWKSSTTLFVTAGAGCGKSVLLRSLVQQDLSTSYRRLCCYFFFHEGKGNELQESALECLKALLHQIFRQAPQLIDIALARYEGAGPNLATHFEELWDILMACANGFDGEIICVIDGLDECGARKKAPGMIQPTFTERQRLATKLASLTNVGSDVSGARFKLLLSARSGSGDDWDAFMKLEKDYMDISTDAERTQKDLEHFIDVKVDGLDLKATDKPNLKEQLRQFQTQSRTYLWLDLIFKLLATPPYRGKSIEDLAYLSSSVEEAFDKLLPDEKYCKETTAIFNLVLSARRPLTLSELSEAFEFAINPPTKNPDPQDGKNFAKTLSTYCGSFLSIATVHDEIVQRNWKGEPETRFETKQTVNFFHQEARRFLVESATSEPLGAFHHALKISKATAVMRTCCVNYIKYCSGRRMESNLTAHYSHEAVVQWLSIYLKTHPFMEYAALHWIYHLPFEAKDDSTRTEVKEEIASLCNVSHSDFRTWFVCCWKLWASEMDMEQFFRIYACAFIGEHIHPDTDVQRLFELEDPIMSESEKWWYWTASSGISEFRAMFEKCEVSYRGERPVYIDTPTPGMGATSAMAPPDP